MLKVGITGGIGSGKSTVCQVFKTLGIPVFFADEAARYLIDNDAVLIDSIKLIFGDDIFVAGKLDREKVSSLVFGQPAKLEQLNAIVHPATIRYAQQWMATQNGPYAIKEAAIFFETGSDKDMDVMIGVYAPQSLRIQRVMQRDGVAQDKVLKRVAYQMDDDEKMERCDYVITNDDVTAIIPQVLNIHKELLEKASMK